MNDALDTRPGASVEYRILAYDGANASATKRYDRVTTEEPLEIRLRAGDERRTIAITMRTPGNEFELAAGFLHNEGILSSVEALRGISFCVDRDVDPSQQYNIVNVDLALPRLPPIERMERHFTTTSACGVCGKANLEQLELRGFTPLAGDFTIDAATLVALPERLRAQQNVFEKTGGLHAAALFDEHGTLLAVREDVGRHNALDKLIGWAFLGARRLPLSRAMVLVSGRTSFELVQKSLAAGIPVIASVSAPSSLAVDLARRFNITLAGFLRGPRFNIYSGETRIRS
jgi:FdhD protein